MYRISSIAASLSLPLDQRPGGSSHLPPPLWDQIGFRKQRTGGLAEALLGCKIELRGRTCRRLRRSAQWVMEEKRRFDWDTIAYVLGHSAVVSVIDYR